MMLKIPDGLFAAYLFDCDGTIADSMPLHHRAWQTALSEWKCDFSEDLFYAWGGTPTTKVIEQLNQKFGLSMPVAEVESRREKHYRSLLSTIGPIHEVVEHIRSQSGKIPLAVVSGSPRDSVLMTLGYLGLGDYFQVIIGAEDSPRGKPHPDPFLAAARILGVEAKACLVFEDADLGIQSAEAAGMKWVRVPGPKERK